MGYASSSHAGVHFGLGTAKEIDRPEIAWSSGTKQTIEHVKTNRVLEIKDGDSLALVTSLSGIKYQNAV